MGTRQSGRQSPKAPAKSSATVRKEAPKGWGAWHQPKVLIPLVIALLTAAGVAATLYTSSSEGRGNDVVNAPVMQTPSQSNSPTNVIAPAAAEPEAQAEVRRQSPRAPTPSRSPDPTAQAPQSSSESDRQSVNIHVDRSPGAISAGTINANSIEVRPPQ